MICKEYAHCTWEHYRTRMPLDEKIFWRLFIENEGKRAAMRETEAYKTFREVTRAPLFAVEDAPLVDAPPDNPEVA